MDPLDGPHPGEDVTNLFSVFHSIEKQSNEVNITANTGKTLDLIYLASTSKTTLVPPTLYLRILFTLCPAKHIDSKIHFILQSYFQS